MNRLPAKMLFFNYEIPAWICKNLVHLYCDVFASLFPEEKHLKFIDKEKLVRCIEPAHPVHSNECVLEVNDEMLMPFKRRKETKKAYISRRNLFEAIISNFSRTLAGVASILYSYKDPTNLAYPSDQILEDIILCFNNCHLSLAAIGSWRVMHAAIIVETLNQLWGFPVFEYDVVSYPTVADYYDVAVVILSKI